MSMNSGTDAMYIGTTRHRLVCKTKADCTVDSFSSIQTSAVFTAIPDLLQLLTQVCLFDLVHMDIATSTCPTSCSCPQPFQ